MLGIEGAWEMFALGMAKVWGLTTLYLVAGVAAVWVVDWLVQRGGSSSSPVILSAAKNLVVTAEILRCAQNDKLLSYFRRAALARRTA